MGELYIGEVREWGSCILYIVLYKIDQNCRDPPQNLRFECNVCSRHVGSAAALARHMTTHVSAHVVNAHSSSSSSEPEMHFDVNSASTTTTAARETSTSNGIDEQPEVASLVGGGGKKAVMSAAAEKSVVPPAALTNADTSVSTRKAK